MFQTRNRLQDRLLHIFRQAGRDAVRVHRRIVQAFRLQEDIVAILVREADNLVLDRRTIPRTPSSDLARVNSRPVDILPYNRVRRLSRPCHPACDLPIQQAGRHRTERLRLIVTRVSAQTRPIDRPSVQSRRSPRLETAKRQSEPAQSLRQPDRRRFPHTAGGRLTVADMDNPAKKRAGCQHDRPAIDSLPSGTNDGRYAPIAIRLKVFCRGRPQCEVRRLLQQRAYCSAVKRTIRLRTRATHRGALAAVQQLEMDAGCISGSPHQPVQCVDLPHQMAFTNPADRRIARHLADRSQ